MSRLTDANVLLAREIISRYPRPKSALIPLLHLAQEQDGYVADDAMAHIAELVDVEPAEVLGTCSFYEMFKREPVGRYVINICTNIACQLAGGEDLLHAAEAKLGIRPGGTTPDGMFTLEDVECIAACTEAPSLQVNYRYEYRVDPSTLGDLIDELRSGARSDIPPHGTLALIRQHIPGDKAAGIEPPEAAGTPAWFTDRQPDEEAN
jgi:NADH-quinone oxidoreductase subunit E